MVSSALLLLFLSPPGKAAEPCPAPVTVEQLDAALIQAETAFGNLDVEAFTAAMDDAVYGVPCLRDAVGVATAARLHRLTGIRQFIAHNEQRAVSAFAAARAADPSYVWPAWLLPEGHTMRDLYARFPLENATTELEPAPLSGALRFDGVEGLNRPTRWPTLVQVVSATGDVAETTYLYPEDAMPAYPMTAPPLAVSSAQPRSGGAPKKVGFVLIGASAISAVGSGAFYGLAMSSAADFERDHPDWDEADLIREQSRTNSRVLASGGLATLAAGAGLSAALLVAW